MLKDIIRHFCVAAICGIILVGTSGIANGQQIQIPSWIKNNAKWWYEGKIADSDFLKGIQYLIQNNMITVQPVNSTAKENTIPIWVKNDAGWWANGTISDSEFMSGIQYLLYSGIIHINSGQNTTTNNIGTKCDNLTTPAEKETCLQQIEYDAKIKRSIATSKQYVIGPVTFYYINSELQPADDGKSILTIHFMIEDNIDQEITMSCPSQDSCNYALSDGEKDIPFVTNTLVYGSLTLTPHTPKFVDWTFYNVFDTARNYSFLVSEPWGVGAIPIEIH